MTKIYSTLGDRMKRYEDVTNYKLPLNSWYVVRLDGKAFHTLTKEAVKPFDDSFIEGMKMAAIETCKEIEGFVMAYVQSDEVNIVFTDTHSHNRGLWFDGRVQKIASVTASTMSKNFPMNGIFDSRVLTIPKDDIPNLFIWRQQDWKRNSIQMLGQSILGHKEMNGLKNEDVITRCKEKGTLWNDLDDIYKYGLYVYSDYSTDCIAFDYQDIKDILDDITEETKSQ